jgi:predicted dehydrogenase
MKSIVVLVIGLGSMGKRRIRNLKALGVEKIFGFDLRADRREEAALLYGINIFESLEDASLIKYDAWIISTPPDTHHIYMKDAINLNVPAFVEASVVDTDMKIIIKDAKENNVFIGPSCTLFFHPGIRIIKDIVESGKLGKTTNILYHSGQYLPDWHTYENVDNYYVSKKDTGGAREIVPFELTWLTKIFGFPQRVTGIFMKTIKIEGAESIDDTYNFLYEYDGYILNLSVDVVSRYATRRLLVNCEMGQIYWDWDYEFIKIFDSKKNEWEQISFETIPAHNGYNKNITEQMYIDELNSFLNAALSSGNYANSLSEDERVLNLLYSGEKAARTNQIQICK